jgi:uncharacterized membrane protein
VCLNAARCASRGKSPQTGATPSSARSCQHLLTFNSAFTLVVAWVVLGETPGVRQTADVAVILMGANALQANELEGRAGRATADVAAPTRNGTGCSRECALGHHDCAGETRRQARHLTERGVGGVRYHPAARHVHNARGVLAPTGGKAPVGDWWQGGTGQARTVSSAFVTAAILTGIAPLFGFSAIAVGLVGYVTALFKLSAVLTVLWGRHFLKERRIRQRLLGRLCWCGWRYPRRWVTSTPHEHVM